MEDIILIIESIKPEQYKTFYKNLPLPSITVNHNKEEYINLLSDNIYTKKILNTMLRNNFNISGVSDNNISVLLDLNNGQIIKYLREHTSLTGIHINVNALPNDILSMKIEFASERDIQVLNQILENYYLVNQSSFNIKTIDYIIKLYQESPKEYLNYIKEINKNEIEVLKEKYIQETSLPFDSNVDTQVLNENEVSIKSIYNNDVIFNKIPFDKLSKEQKQVMCNKYFRKVLNQKLKDFNYKLKKLFGIDYTVRYMHQYEQKLGNYGITGNTPVFDEKDIYEIIIKMYPNVNYCSIKGDTVKLNTDLLGQIMITTLHEHEHILQRLGKIDNNLKNAITNFSNINPDGSSNYIENYNKDPAEIDANITSFNRFIEFSKYFDIENPDKIIMNKVKNAIIEADDNINLYGNHEFTNYKEIQDYLSQRLQNYVQIYNDNEKKNKSF